MADTGVQQRHGGFIFRIIYHAVGINGINHGEVCVVDINSRVCCVTAPGDHEGVDVNNTHPSMINLDYSMTPTISVLIYQYCAY